MQVKDKEAELKSAEQQLHDEFERLRRQNAEEKRQLDDKKRQLVSSLSLSLLLLYILSHPLTCSPPPLPRTRRLVFSTRRRQRFRLSEPRPRRNSWLTNNVVATGNERERENHPFRPPAPTGITNY